MPTEDNRSVKKVGSKSWSGRSSRSRTPSPNTRKTSIKKSSGDTRKGKDSGNVKVATIGDEDTEGTSGGGTDLEAQE